jgi:hypothetical protein
MSINDRRFDIYAGIDPAAAERFQDYGRATVEQLCSQPAVGHLMNANPERLGIMFAAAKEQVPPNVFAIGVVAGYAAAGIRAADMTNENSAGHMFHRLLVQVRSFEA